MKRQELGNWIRQQKEEKQENKCYDVNQLEIEEIGALMDYISAKKKVYKNINDSLRGLEDLKPENEKILKYCKQALDKAYLPKDMVLYRGTNMIELGDLAKEAESDLKSIIGKTFEEKAFTSTSTEDGFAVNTFFTGTLHMKINAPKGCEAMDISPISSSSFTEKEVLFNAGQKFKITDAKKENDVTYIVVDAI